MEWWTKVRLEVLRGKKKKREVLRSEKIGWETLKKILAHPEPPGYRLKEPRPKPKIGAYLERIAQIIEEDKALPKKQRHTAKRIYKRIREMGYGGKYTQVKDAVRELLRVKQEVFLPLIHRAGEAQVDFGYALAKVSYKKWSLALFIALLIVPLLPPSGISLKSFLIYHNHHLAHFHRISDGIWFLVLSQRIYRHMYLSPNQSGVRFLLSEDLV